MITIVYLYCSKEFDHSICDYLNKSCSGIEFCILVPSIIASWQELALALINTLDAVRNRRNIARKLELEFYIRLFANRQIHSILSNYLTELGVHVNARTVLISHNNEAQSCIEAHINKLLASSSHCRYLPKPEDKELHKLYLKIMENTIGSNLDIRTDKAHKISIGIIGCGALLIKD